MSEITTCTLRDGGTEVTVLSIGCAVQDWTVDGQRVVLGYADPEFYRQNPKYLGVVVGRVANRISGSRFVLDDHQWDLPANDGENHLHGGPGCIGWQNWEVRQTSDRSVSLGLVSPHLDQGYPGEVRFSVTLTLTGHELCWQMEAHPDRVTPVNLAQHLYFNLLGSGSVRDHRLRLGASRFTPTRSDLSPTGDILDVTGTRFDFRTSRRIAEADPEELGYDLNFVLDAPGSSGPQVRLDANGLQLELATDRPGMQVYTGNVLAEDSAPHPGQRHDRFGGICLEAQDLPDALNQPGFGSILCSPDRPYRQVTRIRIAPM